MIWAYAIADDVDDPLPSAELRTIAAGGICAVVSEHTTETGAEALLRHERVVEALMATRAVLPLRFGTTLHDDDAVVAALANHGEEWSALLERLRGRVELAATLVVGSERIPAGVGGTDYLMSKVRRHRDAAQVAERIDSAVGDVAEAVHHREEPGFAVKAAYLVERSQVDEARRRIEAAGAICTGPWPPYSFTSAERLR